MLLLYTKDGCPHCAKVKEVFKDRNVMYEERNVKEPTFLQEVKDHGFNAVPVLVDTTANTTVVGTDEIIDYASEHAF